MFLTIEEFECTLDFVIETGIWYDYGFKNNKNGTKDIIFGTALYLEDCELELIKAVEKYYLQN